MLEAIDHEPRAIRNIPGLESLQRELVLCGPTLKKHVLLVHHEIREQRLAAAEARRAGQAMASQKA